MEVCRLLDQHLEASAARPISGRRIVNGHVYLFRYGGSGRDYKIGMTESVSRRHGQIARMNPGDVRIVHVIDTDDPRGIEGYWKRRFEPRKVSGKEEIFRLDAAEVSAFKSRRYQ